MTEEMLSIFMADIPPCPKCHMTDKQIMAELIDKDITVCSYCGEDIPLTDADWRSEFNNLVQGIREQI